MRGKGKCVGWALPSALLSLYTLNYLPFGTDVLPRRAKQFAHYFKCVRSYETSKEEKLWTESTWSLSQLDLNQADFSYFIGLLAYVQVLTHAENFSAFSENIAVALHWEARRQ